jgi:hypothetical protein
MPTRISHALLTALAVALVLPAAVQAASAPTPVNTISPVLTGTPALGQTLTCSPGSWSGDPSAFAYVWLRDGSPIAGQTASSYVVQAVDEGHSLSCAVTAANSGGEYTIAGLPSGAYRISFGHPFGIVSEDEDFLAQYFNGQASAASATAVSVATPNTAGGIDAELQPGGQITGQVTSAATHAPVPGAQVCTSAGFGNCATTDATGQYTIVGLPSGSYSVWVSVYGTEQNYLPGGHEAVSVTAPNITSGINVELQSGGEIVGKVTSATSHAPLANVQVCAFQGEIAEFEAGCVTTGTTGEYAIWALPSMHYTLTLEAQTCVGGQDCTRLNYLKPAIKAVSVTAPNATTVNVELKPGATLAGVITDETTHAPIAEASVCVQGDVYDGERCAPTNAKGEYTIVGLPTASYNLSVTAAGYHNDISVMSITAPNTYQFNAELEPSPVPTAEGEITGHVTSATAHAPLANASVCTEVAEQSLCATTDPSGAYTLSLPSGSYNVAFTAAGGSTCFVSHTAGCTEPNYLSQTVNGVSVSAPNTTTGVDAELQPGGEITGRVTSTATHEGLAGVLACATAIGSESTVSCGLTNAAGGSASAHSNTLVVPAQHSTSGGISAPPFKLAGTSSFNAHTDKLVVVFQFPTPGTLNWHLTFRTQSVSVAAKPRSIKAGAQMARHKHHKKPAPASKCKHGPAKHKRRCSPGVTLFASGSRQVAAGQVTVMTPASAQAITALKKGHSLRVIGSFTFKPASGGSPVIYNESALVRAPMHRRHRKPVSRQGHRKRR